MYRPRGFAVDTQGNIYVADTGGVRMLKVSAANGARLAQVGGPDQTIGAGQPTDTAVTPDGTVFLIEATNGFLWKIDADSGSVFANSQASLPASTIDGPHLAWGPDDLLYVTDPEGFRVIVYDVNLNPVGQFGTQGDGPVQFRKPVGLAVGEDGRVYVADSPACRVQAFGPIER
jgi:DNA-binding beta-propeller fold protein YncE